MKILNLSGFLHTYRPTAVLRITGADAFSFLQGQFTQDLRPCAQGGVVVYGLWLNQKGRVLADSWVVQRADAWFCFSVFSEASVIRERLERFVIADDVVVEDVTALWAGRAYFGEKPPEVDAGFVLPGRRAAVASWEWVYPLGEDRAAVKEVAQPLSEAELEWLRIEAGLPSVPRDIGPGDLPNEGGLEREAISYTKGCYLGQEVMARLKTLGQVRRRLLRVRGTVAAPSVLPAPLFADGKKVGELRSAVAVAEGFRGLAMISLPGIAGRRLLGVSPDGPADSVQFDVSL